jgi:FkbM family methyltransferase
MSAIQKIKEKVSTTTQRALGIDAIRFNLQLALERLEKILGKIEGRFAALEAEKPEARIRDKPTLEDALCRLACHKIEIASLIDVGASDGHWSKAFAKRFPGRHHLLVDANQVHEAKLAQTCQENPNWQFVMSAVGNTTGVLYFDGSDPLGGHLSATPWNERYHPCPVTTVDDLLENYPMPGPLMIKLDTHGVEIPILNGASKALKRTSALIIEVYNFAGGEPAVPFWDLCRSMVEIGFRPLDVFDVLYREVDSAFWQFDLLFVRSDLALFQDLRYFVAGRH